MTTNELKTILLNTNWFEDNSYLDNYIKIILNNIDTEKDNANYHHIIPISCWKLMNKEVDNSFGVNLLPSDHAIVHHLLGLCTIGELRYKMQSCFIRMSGNDRFIENLDYTSLIGLDQLKVEFAEERSKKMTGKKLSEDQCKQISKRSKEMWADTNFKEKMKLKMKEVHQNRTEAESKAIGKKISKTKKGTKCNYCTEESAIKRLETKRANGSIYPSSETKKKISKTLQGHYVSEETRKKIGLAGIGRIPPNAKPVICIETGIEYQSATYANKLFKLSKDRIRYACLHGTTAAGYHWKFKEN